VRRALDAGHDAESLLAFLREHSATEVPQPLEYLVQDTASRHGRLRVSSSASFIQSDDESAIAELLTGDGTAVLGLVRIAPTVLTSTAGPREVARILRGLGLSPTVQEAEAGVVRLKRTTALPGSARPLYAAPRTAPPDDDVDAQIAVLRQERPAEATGEARPQLGLETLQKAIRLKQAVTMNVVDSLGNSNTETVLPVSVSGGRVRVFDPGKDTERVLSIHRIIDVEAAEDLHK
jgi:Helicase conserved C-terminal domain